MHAASGGGTAVMQTTRACKAGITLRTFIYQTSCGLTAFLFFGGGGQFVEDDGCCLRGRLSRTDLATEQYIIIDY